MQISSPNLDHPYYPAKIIPNMIWLLFALIPITFLLSCSNSTNNESAKIVPTTFASDETDDPRFTYPTSSENIVLQLLASQYNTETLPAWVREKRIAGGKVLLIQNNKVILHQVAGWEDKEAGKALALNQIYYIEWLNTIFTEATMLVLADNGQIDFCQPVANYLSAFDNEKSRIITLEQVMQHRSGITKTDHSKSREEYDNLNQFISEIAAVGPDETPGTVNKGIGIHYDILQAVIETVSGKSLQDNYSELLFDALGLDNTFMGVEQKPEILSQLIARYEISSNRTLVKNWDNNQPVLASSWPTNAVYSTISDYAIFLSMWINNGRYADKQVISESLINH